MLWDLNDGKQLYTLPGNDFINALTFSPNRFAEFLLPLSLMFICREWRGHSEGFSENKRTTTYLDSFRKI